MQGMGYSNLIKLSKSLSLTFIRGHKAFSLFHADYVIFIAVLPCDQDQPTGIWTWYNVIAQAWERNVVLA